MAFVQKTWKDRVAEYINRRILTKEDGTTELVSVERSEGTISQEGDAFSAANMNDLEQRIADEFSEQNKNLTASDSTTFRFGVTENGEYGYIVTDEDGADSVIPFKKITPMTCSRTESYTYTDTTYFGETYSYRVENFTSMTISITNLETAYGFSVSVVGTRPDGTKKTLAAKGWNTSSLGSTTVDISEYKTITVGINQTSGSRPAKIYNISFS